MDPLQALEKLDDDLKNMESMTLDEMLTVYDKRLELIKLSYSMKQDEQQYNINKAILGVFTLVGVIMFTSVRR